MIIQLILFFLHSIDNDNPLPQIQNPMQQGTAQFIPTGLGMSGLDGQQQQAEPMDTGFFQQQAQPMYTGFFNNKLNQCTLVFFNNNLNQ